MSNKLKPTAVWALAAGGMVGGGIYTVLGVVLAVSAQWSWLSFAFVGILAVCSAYSYVFLSNKFSDSGGAFAFLREVNDDKLAGSLSWMLILGYILTISVYAYAFGHYVSFLFNGNTWLVRGLALGILTLLISLNLLGVGKMTKVEIAIVSVNLLALLGLGIYGLTIWDTTQLTAGIEPSPFYRSMFGGAAIFMAYEGFQLLSYEYDKIENPKKHFMPVLVSAAIFVVFCYIIVALGATYISGASTLIKFKEVALSIAAQNSFGFTGLLIMTISAAFATSAAINSTLFSTAQLSKRISKKGELPKWFKHTNSNDIPDRAVILIGSIAGFLAILGSLSDLVEAASLIFILTFGIVNWLCYKEGDAKKWIPLLGLVIAAITLLALLIRVAISKPYALVGILLIIAFIHLIRPKVANTKDKSNS